MHTQLICLLRSGEPISALVVQSLLYISQRMMAEQKRYIFFRCPAFEGGMETSFRYQSIGTLGGIRFSANVDLAEGGTTKVVFLADQLDHPELAFLTILRSGEPADFSQLDLDERAMN